MLPTKFDIDAALDSIDLTFSNYIPSQDALEFFNLIRVFFGEDFEVPNPLLHYFIVDCLYGNITREQFPYSEEINKTLCIDPSAVTIIASRGTAKSTITTLFYPIVAAIKGRLPVTGPLSHILILSDSQKGGARDQALIMGSAFEKSVFAKEWFESIRATETEVEVVRKGNEPIEKRHMLIKFKGAQALSLDTVLHTDSGTITMGDVKVGDKIFDPDGVLTTVTAKSDVFYRPMYLLQLLDGRQLKVSEDHLNAVVIDGVYHVLDTESLLKEELVEGHYYRVYVPYSAPVQYSKKPLPVAPKAYAKVVVHNEGRIAPEYRYSSIEDRTELLDALIGADTVVVKRVKESAASMIAEIGRSLGYSARVHETDGVYLVFINRNEKDDAIVSITPIPVEPSQCIAVNNRSRLYLAGSYIPTHNTGGIRSGSRNPVTHDRYGLICHRKGTVVTTDMGTHKVEDYYNVLGEREEVGLEIKLHGLPTTEVVTDEHRYWAKISSSRQVWDKEKKKLITVPVTSEPCWVEAKDLTMKHMVGDPIFTPTVEDIPEASKRLGRIKRLSKNVYIPYVVKMSSHVGWFNDDEFWFLFGLWLADGSKGRNSIQITFSFSEKDQAAKSRVSKYLEVKNKPFSMHKVKDEACEVMTFSHTHLSTWLSDNVSMGYQGGKQIPEFVYSFSNSRLVNILQGYISGDGYIDPSCGGQIRVNSVCPELTYGMARIAELIGLPAHIRYTRKKECVAVIRGRSVNQKKQLELRLKDGVGSILKFPVEDGVSIRKRVVIDGGFVWRRVERVLRRDKHDLFIPIQTPSRTYTTEFGLSHNCADDVIKNEAEAYSETIMKNVTTALTSDAENAMRSKNTQFVMVNTPFHKNDPIYRTMESGGVTPILAPICKEISLDIPKEEWVGVWEAQHSYESVMKRYTKAVSLQQTRSFNQELMLRVSNEEDRLVKDHMIQWYDRTLLLRLLNGYSLYVTTDFTTTGTAKSDFSAGALWAISSNYDYFLLDFFLEKQELDQQYNSVFRLVFGWNQGGRAIEVGVETDGQQKAHMFALKQQMQMTNRYFSFAKQKGAPAGREGIQSGSVGNKHERFRFFLPNFHNSKVYFPEQLRDTLMMKEALKQLKGVTSTGFSYADDFCDAVSQLGLIDIIAGTGSYEPVQGVAVDADNVVAANYWNEVLREDDDDSGYGSTVF